MVSISDRVFSRSRVISVESPAVRWFAAAPTKWFKGTAEGRLKSLL